MIDAKSLYPVCRIPYTEWKLRVMGHLGGTDLDREKETVIEDVEKGLVHVIENTEIDQEKETEKGSLNSY